MIRASELQCLEGFEQQLRGWLLGGAFEEDAYRPWSSLSVSLWHHQGQGRRQVGEWAPLPLQDSKVISFQRTQQDHRKDSYPVLIKQQSASRFRGNTKDLKAPTRSVVVSHTYGLGRGLCQSEGRKAWFWFLFADIPTLGLPWSSVGKESTCNAGDAGSIPGLGRCPRERKGYPHSSILAWRTPWTV